MTEFSANTITKQIEQYVIDHPLCTKADIMRDLNVVKNTVHMTLTRLRAIGRVKKIRSTVKADGRSIRITLWESGIEDGIALKDRREGAPQRKIVKTWAPHAESDQLFNLFFKKPQ